METHLRFPRQAKIIGGTFAYPNEFPYQVHLEYNGSHQCGGSIISTFVILTAAHCLKYKLPNRFNVVAGDHNRFEDEGTEQARNVTHLFLHEDYNWDTDEHDIGLIFLSAPLKFNQFVQPIDYPKTPTEFSGMGVVTGWGRLRQSDSEAAVDRLQKVKVPIVPKPECRRMYVSRKMRVTDQMMCAGIEGLDSCQGDSGGPLTCTVTDASDNPSKTLCGIVSHGVGCGIKGYPGIYTDVSHYSRWINKTIEKYHLRGKCNSDSFYCSADNSCIPRRKICDDRKDCSDNADERTCKQYVETKNNQYRCSNGVSVNVPWLCDGDDDCGDRTDEDKCDFSGRNGTCGSEEFKCAGDGRCIKLSWKCDNLSDCNDNSDEFSCPGSVWASSTQAPTTSVTVRPCKANEFMCRQGYCVPNNWRCDGDVDCLNGIDEMNCSNYTETTSRLRPRVTTPYTLATPSTTPTTTSSPSTTLSTHDTVNPGSISSTGTHVIICKDANHFHCRGFRGGFCIPSSFVCDGEDDCRYGEDEENCIVTSSSSNKPTLTQESSSSSNNSYTYVNLSPIRSTVRPATNTTPVPKNCSKGYFKCRSSGRCITQAFVCDMDNDCEDGSDEEARLCSKPSTCSPYQWRCKSGECIYHRYKCDRDIDCLDGSDERNCFSDIYLALTRL